MIPTQDQACENETGSSREHSAFHLLVGRACQWTFLNVWCRHLYRPTMRLLHRFNLHYAPPSPMSPQYGRRDHWCQWCGLHGNSWTHDPNTTLMHIYPNVNFSDGEAVNTDNTDNLLAVAGGVIEEMMAVMKQVGIGENDIDPNDFPRWKAVAEKINTITALCQMDTKENR